jgi:hypothetical protein
VISYPTPANMAGSRRKSVIWDTISILIEAPSFFAVVLSRLLSVEERHHPTVTS